MSRFVNGFNTLFPSNILLCSMNPFWDHICALLIKFYSMSLTYTPYHDSWDWDLICGISYSFINPKWNQILKSVQNWHTSNRDIRSFSSVSIQTLILPNMFLSTLPVKSNLPYHPSYTLHIHYFILILIIELGWICNESSDCIILNHSDNHLYHSRIEQQSGLVCY